MVSVAALLVTAIVAYGLVGSHAPAVYALSFWHYLLYWWAYRHGAVAPRRFRRDALLMKSIALAAFFLAYAEAAWSWPSVLVMAAGFALNALAAVVLGVDRTYYGWELGEVPHRRVTHFPYSVVPHPMLLGNVLAYAGALANADFRAEWWPLASGHIMLNIGLLVMETAVVPRRGATPRGMGRLAAACWWSRESIAGGVALSVAGGACGALVAVAGGGPARVVAYALIGAAATGHLFATAAAYTRPRNGLFSA